MSGSSWSARRIGAVLGLFALLIGVPIGLSLGVAWPFPSRLPCAAQLSDALANGWVPDPMIIIRSLAVLCWLAWAEIALCLIVEVRAALTGVAAPRITLAGPLQPLIAKLVAASLLGALAFGTRTIAIAQPPLRAAVARYEQVVPLKLAAASEDVSDVAPEVPSPQFAQITVRSRDNLWDLAAEHLGDPFRWREIFELNKGRAQPDGASLREPRLIRPGWVFDLPGSLPIGAEPAPSQIPSEAGAVDPVLGHAQPRPSPQPSASSEARTEESAPQSGAESAGESPSIRLPGGSVVSLTLAAGVASALAAIRLRRRRIYRPSPPAPATLELPAGDEEEAARVLEWAAFQSVAGARQPEAASTFLYRGLDDPKPTALVVGERDRKPVEIDLAGLGCLSFTGKGAPAVIRSIVTTLLAKGNPCVFNLIMSRPTAERLLPGVRAVDGLRIVASLNELFQAIEVECLYRTRLLDDGDFSDIAAFRDVGSEPIATLVAVIDGLDERGSQRVAALAGLGARLGMAVIAAGVGADPILGVEVGTDGSVVSQTAESSVIPSEVTWHRVTEDECRMVLGQFAQAAAFQEDAPPLPGLNGRRDRQMSSHAAPKSVPNPGHLVTVRFLGAYRIEIGGQEIRTGLRTSARELLAFYLLQPQGASVEKAIDTMWPTMELKKGTHKFWASVTNLRTIVSEATGAAHPLFEKSGQLYAVEPGVFSVDVWSLQAALSKSSSLAAGQDKRSALAEVIDLYLGALLDEISYAWAAPLREELRLKVLDACVALADLIEEQGDEEGALRMLNRAIDIDPYAEDLYQRAFVLLDSLRRPVVAQALYAQLAMRLAELDLAPSAETSYILQRLALSSRPVVR